MISPEIIVNDPPNDNSVIEDLDKAISNWQNLPNRLEDLEKVVKNLRENLGDNQSTPSSETNNPTNQSE